MKGRVLGFNDDGSGAISGDDGKRYRIASGSWRGERKIAAGDHVDFDARDDEAYDIYPAVGGSLGSVNLDGVADAPAVRRMRELVTGTLAFPLAVLIIIACFLPALSSPVRGASMWSLGSISDGLNARLAGGGALEQGITAIDYQIRRARENIARAQGSGMTGAIGSDYLIRAIDNLEEQKANLQQRQSSLRWFGLIDTLMPLRFLAPITAAILIFLAWTGKPLKFWPIVAGAAAIGAAVLVFLLKGAVVGMVSSAGPLGDLMGGQMQSLISIGIGTWLLFLLGLGLVASGLGFVHNPLRNSSQPAS